MHAQSKVVEYYLTITYMFKTSAGLSMDIYYSLQSFAELHGPVLLRREGVVPDTWHRHAQSQHQAGRHQLILAAA